MNSSRSNAAAILDRLIDPEKGAGHDPLRMLLDLRFGDTDLKRMNRLASKARAGTLLEKEQAEIASYELVGHLLSLLKSKARRMLKKSSNGA